MKASTMFLHTLREVPAEAEIQSHVLLLRAGMIDKLVSGIYGFLPLGLRSLRKIEDIVRQEMDKAGAQEILMSAVQPAELWEESGRWFAYGPELWRLKDRHQRDFCLGPTHEEVFTDTVRQRVSSYRQLPFNLYQIQTKYRDEARPRFGLIRSREFIMKDAYSFDRDEAGLDESYRIMYRAYEKIFDRCGLVHRAVEADTGAIGGSNSHEFTALSEVGESEIVYCDHCHMAATVERAAFKDAPLPREEILPLEEVHTPGTKTIEAVSDYLGIPKEKTMKALLFSIYRGEDAPLDYAAVFVRGDRQLNKTKLVNALDVPEFALEFADEEAMHEATGSVGGFTGPIGLHDCLIVVDSELVESTNLCAGACKVDHHYINVNYGRDYQADLVVDLKLLAEGDACPICQRPVRKAFGIEVGQVFKLGTKYSQSMKAYYKDEEMQDQPIVMGCYGIGVTRTLAAVVEQHHDENGILWPMSVTPYHVMLVQVNMDDEAQTRLASLLYDQLQEAQIQVCYDDRRERPGVKFKDADLLGFPIRITVGKQADQGLVEYKLRREKDYQAMTAADALQRAVTCVREEEKGTSCQKK